MARLQRLAADHKLRAAFAPEVRAEVQSIQASPGIDDPKLVDRTALPFITIDNPDSRDLDQAMCIQRDDSGGYRVFYALADASYYVRPGTALFDEALSRGATYYFPGFSVPMLPRDLSEDLVSLNPGVDRRALTVCMALAADGAVLRTQIERSRICSRSKLSYQGVQAFHDAPDGHPLSGQDFSETLELLGEVGALRIADLIERDVVRFDRSYVEVGFTDAGQQTFSTVTRRRNQVEKWNEQISLMCNVEGARLLRQGGHGAHVQPIFRVHAPPPESRCQGLVALIDDLVEAHGLDTSWRWHRASGQTLSDYLDGLPEASAHARLNKAIRRQALVINQRSVFAVEAGRHYGIGADEYSRFSSPMREMVGIFTHKEALELLSEASPATQAAQDNAEDEALRAQVIEAANRAKALQKRVSKASYGLVLDQMFRADLDQAADARPVRTATVMGMSATRLYVELDDPCLDVKVYGVNPQHGLQIGDLVRLRITGQDDRGRWTFAVV